MESNYHLHPVKKWHIKMKRVDAKTRASGMVEAQKLFVATKTRRCGEPQSYTSCQEMVHKNEACG